MEIIVVRGELGSHGTPCLVVGVPEETRAPVGDLQVLDQAFGGQIAALLRTGDFKGREGQTYVLYPREAGNGPQRVMLVGLGKVATIDRERLRRAAGSAVKQAARLGIDRLATTLHRAPEGASVTTEDAARAVAEGLELGSYLFDEYKAPKEGDASKRLARAELIETTEDLFDAVVRGAKAGSIIGRATNFARTLGNLPGNVATPDYLARRGREIGDRLGMKVTILGPEEMAAENMGALLAVARGTEEEPRLIVLEHRRGPADQKPLVLVGKGLTFDSGGISIKPAAGMEEMKFDMCGGAAVLAAMQAIGELEIPINVVGIVPSSENLISGQAMKPGDIIRSRKGTTIEVVNTDAEGRLILADALSYASRFEPAAIVDCATLTGACVVALGHQATAGLTNNDALLQEIRDAGDRVGERVWQLPMFDEYRDQIKSEYADIKNSGGRPAGTITAAWFLREFVGDTPWVHLDIAGTAYGDGKLPYHSKGSTGTPTRLFVDWVLARAG
jgi:leucyl aminopeptidase